HAGVTAQAEQLQLPAGIRFPEMDGLVFAGRSDESAIRTEGDRHSKSAAVRQPAQERAGRRIPDVHAAVEVGRAEHGASVIERQRANGMPGIANLWEGAGGADTRCRVPNSHASLPVPRRQAPAVPTEGHADPALVVSGEGVYRLLVSPVPERDDAAES